MGDAPALGDLIGGSQAAGQSQREAVQPAPLRRVEGVELPFTGPAAIRGGVVVSGVVSLIASSSRKYTVAGSSIRGTVQILCIVGSMTIQSGRCWLAEARRVLASAAAMASGGAQRIVVSPLTNQTRYIV